MIQIKEENGCMTISFDGRLDSSLTTEIQQELAAKLNDAPGVKELTWDGCGMEYISSSGLRLMLMLKKKYPSFKCVSRGARKSGAEASAWSIAFRMTPLSKCSAKGQA